LCFQAQQAAEKAIKAVLIHLGVEYPYRHDLGTLLTLVIQAGVTVPDKIKQAARLTRYAVAGRYPGLMEPVTEEEYESALQIASDVLEWAEEMILR
jgi:HEPN domain-containing protein